MRIGVPSAVQNLIYAGISMILTRLITGWGDLAVAAQRVGSQIESVSWMVGDGFRRQSMHSSDRIMGRSGMTVCAAAISVRSR